MVDKTLNRKLKIERHKSKYILVVVGEGELKAQRVHY
jgi:hypothetical protein